MTAVTQPVLHEPPQGKIAPALDLAKIRADFPILAERIYGKRLVYLDNAATSQKPRAVIDAITHYYEHLNANIHRGVHTLSVRATEAHDAAREIVSRFLNAADRRELVFVRGATEAINLVAQTYGRAHVGAGDEILITAMEHHSNIVPWQILCEEKGAHLRVAPIDDRRAQSAGIPMHSMQNCLHPARTRKRLKNENCLSVKPATATMKLLPQPINSSAQIRAQCAADVTLRRRIPTDIMRQKLCAD